MWLSVSAPQLPVIRGSHEGTQTPRQHPPSMCASIIADEGNRGPTLAHSGSQPTRSIPPAHAAGVVFGSKEANTPPTPPQRPEATLTLRVLSLLLLTNSRLSLLHATWKTGPTCPLKVATKPPLTPSHSFILLSKLADSTQRPSGLKVTCRAQADGRVAAVGVTTHRQGCHSVRGCCCALSSSGTLRAAPCLRCTTDHQHKPKQLACWVCFLQAADAVRTWFMSCTCPVMRATCVLLVEGVHRNMVWSSDPLTNRSGWPRTTASYRCCATCRHKKPTQQQFVRQTYQTLAAP